MSLRRKTFTSGWSLLVRGAEAVLLDILLFSGFFSGGFRAQAKGVKSHDQGTEKAGQIPAKID
jgi:hypothetical protein